MSEALAAPGWVVWGVGLAVGFPVVAVLLAQWASRARRSNPTLARVIGLALHVMLPLIVIYLFLRLVVGQAPDALGVRVALTAILIGGISLVLGFVNAYVFGRQDAVEGRARTPKLLRDLIQVILVVIGAAIVLSNVWDQDVGGLFTALGVGSIVLGLALQETLGNVMSGIALLMERPFGEGDWVRFDQIEGKVEQINWRAVRLVDRAGDTIIVPHSIAGRGIVVNNTLPRPTERNLVNLSFSHVHPPNRVKAMLREALESTADILEDPPASVSTFGYTAEAADYVAVFHVADATAKFRVREAFMTNVWYAAQRHGISLALPLRRVMPVEDVQTEEHATRDALRSLADLPMLRGFADDEERLRRFLADARLEVFAAGERMLHQGRFGSSLHLIVEGEAKVERRGARTGRTREMFELGRGDFFGEIAMFTGAASPYSVVARDDVRVLRLQRAAVDELVAHRPTLNAEIGRIMDARRRAVAGRPEPLEHEAAETDLEKEDGGE